MKNLEKILKELSEREHEIELLRKKVLKGEVSGIGIPELFKQIQAEINYLKAELLKLKYRKKR